MSAYSKADKLFSSAAMQFQSGVEPALITLTLRDSLRALKLETEQPEWEEVILQSRLTEIFSIYQQEPICFRAHNRPRGYSGDAALLDMVYRRDHRGIDTREVTNVGNKLFQAIASCNAPTAVRTRAVMSAGKIDQVLTRQPSARILSIACGHLEELNRSLIWHVSTNARIVAFDQDPLSLETVSQRFLGESIDCVQGDVKRLLGSQLLPGPFDLIYSTGLFDYLSDRFAARLIGSLSKRLGRGGTLYICNFHSGMIDDAFMDTVMDWRLIYRTPEALRQIAEQEIAESEFHISVSDDLASNLAVLEIVRL